MCRVRWGSLLEASDPRCLAGVRPKVSTQGIRGTFHSEVSGSQGDGMYMIEAFNRTVGYIDTTLRGGLDERTVSRLSGYSYPLFSRIFSILTGSTLSEYIRCRKLTQAAIDLRDTDEKVIDVAVGYGYESADSFAAAFKRFHGSTPTEVRGGRPFKVVSRVQLALSVQGGRSMDVTIQRKPAFKVAGIDVEGIDSSLCPRVWDELLAKHSLEELSALGDGQSYGICHDVEDTGAINYMACFDVADVRRAREMGLVVLDVPEAEYAVVKLHGAVPGCIHEGWKYVMEVFFPEHGYTHSGAPDFEVYGEGDMHDPTYDMELWVPVVKA